MAAFEFAVSAGADMVELDLQRCRDGEVVILHDPTLARLWGVDRAVADLDLAEVQAIGSVEVAIPTLREVLEGSSIPLMVDFTTDDVVPGAVSIVRDASAMDRSLFVTGNVAALRLLRSIAPEARIGLTWDRDELPTSELLDELAAEFWNPMFHLVSEEKIEQIHSLGRKVSTWTVDDPADMVRVAAAGVDAIVSNRISDLRRVLDPTLRNDLDSMAGPTLDEL